MTPSPLDLQPVLEFALDAAWQAGKITLGHFQSGIGFEKKADNSPVTVADQQSERKLRELINRRWPEHGIIGEEFGEEDGSSGLTWIIDPIDGTKSFVHGVPIYAVLVTLADGDHSLVGVAHFPALNETVYAARGLGCFWNGRRVRTSSVDTLAEATLLASDINVYEYYGKAQAWQKLLDATYIHRTWGDAYGYALVATGRAEIMVDPWMAVWDCGPFQVILEEAGGTFTDWGGHSTIHGGEAVATNGVLFHSVMELINGAV